VPTVAENVSIWAEYDWTKAGEEWSEAWGGSEAQWYGAILPRIARFLPTGSTLEIAPGYGRWTEYVRRYCERLALVDLSVECIRACRQRFAGDDRITYHVNDGMSLSMIEDTSVDFVFSFDSLVHAESDVIARYLQELSTKLAPNGVGFIHHSNAGEYRRYFQVTGAIRPRRALHGLFKARILDDWGWRALSMTAREFREHCEAAGLQCITQELINWDTRRTMDCMSTFTTRSSSWARPNRIIVNPGFMAEAKAVKRRAPLYSSQL
jgi:cyclopropane fatty-acyl-phospholipid synthase-like methyltransferase